MNILYYNLQLGSFDGSNSHATGMLSALCNICGRDHVLVANDSAPATYNHKADKLNRKLGPLMDPLRVLKKRQFAAAETQRIVAKVQTAGFHPDVLLARSVPYDNTPLMVADALGCKLILETNTPFVYESCDLRKKSLRLFMRPFESRLLGRADGIYAVSQELVDLLEEQYGGIQQKACVVPNGFDAGLYKDINEDAIRAQTRTLEGLEDLFVVAFVGSLQEWHGIPRLLEIAASMQGDAGVHFIVMGDGALRDQVQNYESQHTNLTWYGNVDQRRMRDLLLASDLGIMPYNQVEHFFFSPLKMYDMVGAGLPFLGGKLGQIETFVHGIDRGEEFVCPSFSAFEYGKRICRIQGDSTVRDRMKMALVENRESCSWDARAAVLADWMVGIINEN